MRTSPASPPALAAALAISLVALPASANGKFPAAGQIVVDPGDANHILVRTTFGILVSRDAGATFDWICESGAGYAGNVDPGIAVTGSGALLAGIVDGLDVGRGDACQWEIAKGALAGRAIADVSVVKSAPSRVAALAVDPMGNLVFRSDDDALSWTQAGPALPSAFQGITLDVAPSAPERVYVSGLDKSVGAVAALARSDSNGSWMIQPIPEAMGRAPYLAAVDPANPEVVYVRLDGTPGVLLVTKDGGATWESVFQIPGYIQGFALSPDGATVLAGGPTDGLWRAPTASFAFERISSMGVQCLSWSGESVYACGTSFAVGRSKSAGEGFDPLLRLACIRGPLACDPTSSVGSSCPAEWPQLMVKVGSMYCDEGAGGGAVTPDAGAGGGGGGAGSGAVSPSGCACRAGHRGGRVPIDGGGPACVVAALSILAALRTNARRRRRGAGGTPSAQSAREASHVAKRSSLTRHPKSPYLP